MTTKATARKKAAKARPSTRQGKLTREETTYMIMLATEAYEHQIQLGVITRGLLSFEDFRRDQVFAAVEREGVSKIQSDEEYKITKAHFLTLAGREPEALEIMMTTGFKSYRPQSPDDTHERSGQFAFLIREALDKHAAVQLAEGTEHIGPGWLLTVARQRTKKQRLTMDNLASELDPRTLVGLLSHLRNHIARREGRETPGRRRPRKR